MNRTVALVLVLTLAFCACGDSNPRDGNPFAHDDGTGMRRVGLAVLEALRRGDAGPVLEQAVEVSDCDAVMEWKRAEGSVTEERLRQARAEFGKIVANAREEIRETLPRCRARGEELGIDWADVDLVLCEDGGGDDLYVAFRHGETYYVVIARSIQLSRGRVLTGRLQPPRSLDTLSPERRERILRAGR